MIEKNNFFKKKSGEYRLIAKEGLRLKYTNNKLFKKTILNYDSKGFI